MKNKTNKKYTPKVGSRMITNQADAELVGSELDKIEEKYGEVSPKILISQARQRRHPLHRFFEWNDTEAAKQHRLLQARQLINSVTVVIETLDRPPVETQAFVNVGSAPGYTAVGKVLSDDELRAQLFQQAWNAIQNLKKKYEHLSEFEEVWRAIQKVEKKSGRQKRTRRKVASG